MRQNFHPQLIKNIQDVQKKGHHRYNIRGQTDMDETYATDKQQTNTARTGTDGALLGEGAVCGAS